jgi:phytoene/squalene synthetase
LGISFLHKDIQKPVYSIYGFVRFADEIVDSFHDYNKEELLADFREDTYKAIRQKISLNPILNSFQWVYHAYNFEPELVDTFLDSMAMDLSDKTYDQAEYEKYILGSAEVVGLMCLKVFTGNDNELYERLKPNAMKLGSAFQKINFLRDLKDDYQELGRTYFPHIEMSAFDDQTKKAIEEDIQKDFRDGYEGIMQLPKKSRFGVYMAYVYYYGLLKKIQNTSSSHILQQRVRIPNGVKYALFARSYVQHSLNLL